MSYVSDARVVLDEELGELHVDPRLKELYLLLLLILGGEVSRVDVHDAWAIWKDSLGDDEHPALVPFSDLDRETGDKDQPYVDAIHRAAARFGYPT
jgi:hypothetical protein